MKKIILAFDGVNFSGGAIEFAKRLSFIEPILLTGVFLPQTQLAHLWNYASVTVDVPPPENDESGIIQKNIERFESLCQKNGIEYRVHNDYFDFAIPELKKESLYADLLILGSEMFYEQAKGSPIIYLQETLHDIKCPVLVVPEKFAFPDNIILAYNGSEESVFAIKQFAYLFPELCKLKTLLVYADRRVTKEIPERIQLEELLARHFPDLTLFKLNLDPKDFFTDWVNDNRSAVLVSGSYSRSEISQLFKKSFVKDVIIDHKVPVFIAHK